MRSRSASASHSRFAPAGQRHPRRLAARLDRRDFSGNAGAPIFERGDLFPIEGDLLLLPVDRELAGVRRLAGAGRARLGLGHLDAQPAKIALHMGDPRRRHRLALARVGQASARRFDGLRQLAILPREQHLFPAPELVAQLLIPARLGRLPFQRAALLLDLEHDIVHARQVLPRRVELQFGGAAARLVLRDAGGFLDQLAPVGRPRAEDHADFPLLDDRVVLRAKAGIHQQVVHVAQPARLAVDQVLAFPGAVQPARHFHFARNGLNQLDDINRGRDRCHCRVPLPWPLPLPCDVGRRS